MLTPIEHFLVMLAPVEDFLVTEGMFTEQQYSNKGKMQYDLYFFSNLSLCIRKLNMRVQGKEILLVICLDRQENLC
jgi:hypothetical protein